MEFNKIHYDGETTTVEYEIIHGLTTLTPTLRSRVAPGLEFEQALQAFQPDVITLCGLPPSWKQDLTVRGISITRRKGVRGIVVSTTKPLANANGPLNISTPVLFEPGDNGEVGMSRSMVRHLSELLDITELYVQGRTGQTNLFDTPAADPAVPQPQLELATDEPTEDQESVAADEAVAATV